MRESRKINNPLTLIGVFAGLAELAGTGVLPLLDGRTQAIFIWYVMGFPVLLVLLFFVTLLWKAQVLYGPSDYRQEENFVAIMGGAYASGTDETSADNRATMMVLRDYWKPDGRIDSNNERNLREWMARNGIPPGSVTFFLTNESYAQARLKAVSDLSLVP